jgi:PIN domain nuclease of toxin-antitoxin system
VRLLLDAHVLLWWLSDDRRLKTSERRAIADRDALVYVSAVTIWEIGIKRNLGRLELDLEALEQELQASAMIELAIKWRHARATAGLPRYHDDPFDRLLVTQAQAEGLTIVSYDKAFREYDVAMLPAIL